MKKNNLHTILKRLNLNINEDKEIDLESIAIIVTKYFKIPFKNIFIKSKEVKVVQPKQISMYLSKRYTEEKLKTISTYYCLKNHTSVIHASVTVENDMLSSEEYKENISVLKTIIEIVYNCKPITRNKGPK